MNAEERIVAWLISNPNTFDDFNISPTLFTGKHTKAAIKAIKELRKENEIIDLAELADKIGSCDFVATISIKADHFTTLAAFKDSLADLYLQKCGKELFQAIHKQGEDVIKSGKLDLDSLVEKIEQIRDMRAKLEIEKVKVTRVADVPKKSIKWLWRSVFPLCKISLLSGDGGVGKSIFALHCASRITSGKDFTIDKDQKAGSVIYVVTEDSIADTIRARAEAMKANLDKLFVIDGAYDQNGEIKSFNVARNIKHLERAIMKIGDVRLVVIDPITEFIGNIDDHRAAPTRSALAPLVTLAEDNSLAILLISHLNKDETKRAIYRTTGSQSYVNMARSVWTIAADEENKDRRFFMPVKQNLSSKPDALAFTITEAAGIQFEDFPVDVKADDLMASDDQKYEKSALQAAKEFILEMLDGQSLPSKEIFREAGEVGIARRTMERAKSELNIEHFPDFNKDKRIWKWRLRK